MTKQRIYCNSCQGETLHEVVAHHEHERYDDLFGFTQLFVSDILKCCGCEDVTFRLVRHPFEFQDEEDQPTEAIFPERSFKQRKRRLFYKLPKRIYALYHETVTAHDNKLLILSTVGLRSLIEAIVADKVDARHYTNNLESKIEALKQHFPESVTKALHDFRVMGNKAAHELDAPESLNIHHALYVVEGMLEFFYGIEEHVELFKKHRER